MNQPSLHPSFDVAEPFDWSGHAVSLSFNETRIIRWIIDLYNGGKPFDVDACYSTGRFWQGLPQPLRKFDIHPQANGVEQADARHLPLEEASVTSVMFDPPFVVAPSPAPGIIRDRFTCFKNIAELWRFYSDALQEFARILSLGGLVAFKCQDMVSGGKPYWSHTYIMNEAARLGFACIDLFILGRNNVLWSPNMKRQQHARKNHCYFLVFVKGS